MEKFNLPPQFRDLLEQNTPLSGLVDSSLAEFGPWLERNNVKFFTEYTDHSLKHVEEVLLESDDLIREQCRGIITPADIATLILATLLHDCAMHLTVDGFIDLVQSKNRPLIESFKDKPWNILWADFMAEARRFSGRKLMALFGNTEPVRYPPMSSQEMTGRDLLLIGEFLRRHHPRLAHEIALFGVPSSETERLRLTPTDDNKFIVELAGVVTRSHGMEIRACIPYLKHNFGSEKIYKGVHIVFMMALLRISDILQIQSSRAARQVEKVQKIESPVSSGEWAMHQAIDFVNKNSEDPETVMVIAHPPNVRTYLRIRRMLDDIQYELDSSWTVIGEVYGYIPQFRELGLKYRRIKSNIDDIDTFSKQVKYVPTQASFEVADTDLLKLLVGPLYGYRPEIGIRELVQNAIDAVRELQEFQRQHPELINVELTQQDGDVVISINPDEVDQWWITVSDRGIGMTTEVVRDYFLKAGASLRRNEIWRKTFEDEQGKSKVLRSGRFGVGALAAFLLGDEIFLSTRYVNSKTKEGVEFISPLDAESIEFRHVERPVGTTIKVRLSEETKNTLMKVRTHGYGEQAYDTQGDDWDWYYLDKPKVTRYISGKLLEQQYDFPLANAILPVGWNRISHPDYDDIQWTYIFEGNKIICNGIVIEDKFSETITQIFGDSLHERDFADGYTGFRAPSISVFDPNASLPINLQRTEISTETLPFRKELQESVIKDFIAYLMVNTPTEPLFHYRGPSWYENIKYNGISSNSIGRNLFSRWFSTKDGVGLADLQSHILQTGAKSAVLLFDYGSAYRSASKSRINIEEWLKYFEKTSLFFKYYTAENLSLGRFLGMHAAAMFADSLAFAFSDKELPSFIQESRRVLISRKIFQVLEPYNSISDKVAKIFLPKIEINELLDLTEWENDDWILLKSGACPTATFDFEGFTKHKEFSNIEEWPCILTELYLGDGEAAVVSPLLEQMWNELLQSPVIPYDIRERKKLFTHAYKELAPFIQAHESINNIQSRE